MLDGEDIRITASNLLTEDENKDFDRFIAGEITLSGDIESAVANAMSQDMARKYAATGAIALEFWGDIALSTVSTEHVKDLMWFVQRIPALHGKKHGNNRFVKDRQNATKREEIEIADLHDGTLRAEIEADELLPLPEKRARLAEVLVPRLAMTTVGHHLDRLHAIFRNAQETLEYKGQIRFLTNTKMQQHIKVQNEKNKDPLFFRKEKPKDRDSWSQDRLRKLLLSPIFTGCGFVSQRWKPGTMIVRDAKYWVPLLVMTLGSRILEVLQLKKTDLIVQDGVLSLQLGITAEHRVKTSDSKRVLPLPQLLIDLSFVEWVHSLPANQRLLFPSPAKGADIAAISGNFGKQLKTLFTHLGIADWHEDFYALRKTMSSALEDAGVPENHRQAIAGHAGGTTINRSYTRRNVSTLKSELDKFDLKVTVGFSERLGHPIIESCDLLAKPGANVEVELDADDTARVVRIKSTQCGKVLVHARSIDAHPSKYQIGNEFGCTSKELAVRLRKISEDYHLCLV
ncbi:tyrosine-type recombinase/integrase [Ruegeria sp. Ofav3-42]|uniref:tyrosine-type recombinase/integrase n=1 Tax=Ruegeria sp. Ofav3-42 TaxID=2917759 RepID=UPI001EF44140|nr:tyrosine-type recombinase/integrase [Ruegeria sp. Ofav3-42]